MQNASPLHLYTIVSNCFLYLFPVRVKQTGLLQSLDCPIITLRSHAGPGLCQVPPLWTRHSSNVTIVNLQKPAHTKHSKRATLTSLSSVDPASKDQLPTCGNARVVPGGTDVLPTHLVYLSPVAATESSVTVGQTPPSASIVTSMRQMANTLRALLAHLQK